MAASRRDGSAPLRVMRAVLLLLALGPLGTVPLVAQQPATAELDGRVFLADTAYARARVTLHRVTTAGSGPLDSLVTGRDGSFRFTLPSVPNPEVEDAIYFASVVHDGVSYFGQAIHLAAQLDSVYEIRVYDTQQAPPEGGALDMQARYTLLEPAEGYWTVTDLLQVSNPLKRTLVPATGGVTWSYPLPEKASDLEVGGDSMSPDQIELVGGRIRIASSIPPGPREFVVRYRVPDPFVTFPLSGFTGEFELLVKEPAPAMEVAGLTAAQPVEMEPGNVYRRFIQDSIQGGDIVVRKGKGESSVPSRWLAVGLALVLALAALYSVLFPKREAGEAAGAEALPGPRAPARLSPFERRQHLLLDVARLDALHESGAIADPDEWAKRRRALLEQVQEIG